MNVQPTAAALWSRFVAPLRSFVARRAPRGVEPDDVVQDVFVRIQEQLPNLRDADRIDAWIFQIARNVVADVYRRRGRDQTLVERAANDTGEPIDDGDRGAATALASCVAAMVAQLPAPYREAIELTELRGLTQLEAARRVGLSLSGMKSRVQRGREHLKEIIHGCCRIELDVRGKVTECDPLRLSPCSFDSPGMNQTNETNEKKDEKDAGCCGGPAPAESGACCVRDAEVKATGGAGCGCEPEAAAPAVAVAAAAAPAPRKGCC